MQKIRVIIRLIKKLFKKDEKNWPKRDKYKRVMKITKLSIENNKKK
jgi:hypothetical protein